MTVDQTSLKVLAVGNHRAGYQGLVRIIDGSTFEWVCRHAHSQTQEARNCARREIQRRLEEVA